MHPWVTALSGSTLAALWNGEQAAVTEIRQEGLKLRTAEAFAPGNITVYFLHFDTGRYEEVALGYMTPVCFAVENGAHIAEFSVENDAFAGEVNRLLLQQGRYMRLRASGDDAYLAGQMTGCPEEETPTGPFYKEKKKWLSEIMPAVYPTNIFNGVSLAISLENRTWYDLLLRSEPAAFFERWISENGFERFAPARLPVKRLYIGNGYCKHLCPDEKQVLLLLDKAFSAGLEVTMTAPCLEIGQEEQAEKRLDALNTYLIKAGQSAEIACNDLGLLRRTAAYGNTLKPIMGLLLSKRPKDPRGAYVPQRDTQTALNLTEYRMWLKEKYGLDRVEAEACRLLPWPQKKFSVHVPFYVTNVSTQCPLAASVVNGNRGSQASMNTCPRYCEKYAFSYPAWLKTVGRYNAVFSFEEQALSNPAILMNAIAAGADRLVLEGLQ